jgi:hypothetical protein
MGSRFFLLLFLAGGATALAQCTSQQTAACRTGCGPGSDVGQRQFDQCLNTCLKRCETKANCKWVTGEIFPKYYILQLVYAPPGCTSTATQKCSGQSSVAYQGSFVMGTSVSIQNSFAPNVTATVDLFPSENVWYLGGNVTGSYNIAPIGDVGPKSMNVTKAPASEVIANGAGDGVDHNQDAFILLVNPGVAIQQHQPTYGDRCGPVQNTWFLGVDKKPSASEITYTVTVGGLKNPATMPGNVAAQLKALGFTNSDFQNILARDPFAGGSTEMDPSRFTPTSFTVPYESEAGCVNISGPIASDPTAARYTKPQYQYSVSFTLGNAVGTLDPSFLNFGPASDQKLTWTVNQSGWANDQIQTGTLTLACPSQNYRGPTFMRVYWDSLFGSFLFVPTTLTSPEIAVLHKGVVTDASGKPVVHEAITLAIADKTYHTWTDSKGNYTFFREAALGKLGSLTSAVVSIKGRKETVALGSAQPVQIHLP